MYDLHNWEPLGGTFHCEACGKPIDKHANDTILINNEAFDGPIYKFHSDCILKLSADAKALKTKEE
tara:strand:+ start:461 stop:658 length:198 start_codon:yes stop_codon:yes gene_type:complete